MHFRGVLAANLENASYAFKHEEGTLILCTWSHWVFYSLLCETAVTYQIIRVTHLSAWMEIWGSRTSSCFHLKLWPNRYTLERTCKDIERYCEGHVKEPIMFWYVKCIKIIRG
jgi:hypothetical protein